MVSIGGTLQPLPRWLIDAADRIALYMKQHNHDDWAVGGIQSCNYASQPQKIPEGVSQAIQKAYGHLWMVNNEPGTPHQYSPEEAAYKARRLLRELLTKEERGDGINSAMLEAAPEVKP